MTKTRNMRIALIGYEANIKNRVGSNQYAFELIKELHRIDEKNEYTIYLPSMPLPDMPRERNGWKYKVVGPAKLWNFIGLPIALFCQKPKPDFVFNPGHYCPLFSPSPLIISIMDLGYIHFPEQFTARIRNKLRWWTALSIRRAKHIFAISEKTKNDIVRIYGRKPEDITVTYPGYNSSKFKVQSSKLGTKKIKEKYGIKREYILYLGSLKPSKNIEGLLDAFRILTSSCPNIALVIAGKKGWMYESIFEKVKTLGLSDKIIFTGFVDENDVPMLMAGARALALVSLWEGFGIPVIEAMASGTPVIVSNAGSLPEVVGDAGIVVDPKSPADIAEALKSVLVDKGRYNELSRKGLVRAREFSWEECARKTLRIIEQLSH